MPRTPRLWLLALALLPAPLAAEVMPDAASGPISQLVARILERTHYNRHPLDDSTSTQTLRMYLDSLDYQHMVFEKSDVDSFETLYGENLDDRVKVGDVQPAYEIFNRFVDRLEEKSALVKKLTAQAHDFTLDERFVFDRKDSPWPATPADTAELWRLRIKNELLQERLGTWRPPENAKPGKVMRMEVRKSTDAAKPEDPVKSVNLRYERLLRSYREFDSNDVLQLFLTAVADTFDPHSEYMGPPQKETFDINMRLSLTGIGAVLRSEDGYAKIVSLVTGGPADVDKRLKPNDKIEGVAQGEDPFVDVVGMKLDRVVQMIRGPKGTAVRLRVIPNDALDPATRVVISLVRDEIKLTEQEAKAKTIDWPVRRDGGKSAARKAKLGVIDLPSFYADMKGGADSKSTTRDVARLIAALRREGVEGIVLDLRRNGGGSLSEAISLTGLFIKDGPVVQVKDVNGDVRVLRDTDPDVAYEGPLIVLTSRASASASEILAAAMQDYRRAVLVGERSTFGKGTVQSMIELDEFMPPPFRDIRSGALKLTIQKFYRISGDSTQNRGVIPDIHLPAVTDFMEVTESSLKNALPFDQVKPAEYNRLDATTFALHNLKRASKLRVDADPDYAFVREDIARYKKQKDDRWISLNEKKRLAEKESDYQRTEARKKQRASRKAPLPEFKEITLSSLDGAKPKPQAEASKSGVASSTAPAPGEEGEGYEKAPPAQDYELLETLSILSDLLGMSGSPGHVAGGRRRDDATP